MIWKDREATSGSLRKDMFLNFKIKKIYFSERTREKHVLFKKKKKKLSNNFYLFIWPHVACISPIYSWVTYILNDVQLSLTFLNSIIDEICHPVKIITSFVVSNLEKHFKRHRMSTAFDPVIPLLRIYLKEIIQKERKNLLLTKVLFIMAKKSLISRKVIK